MIFGKIKEPYWNDRPVAVIAGGPSLQDFDLEQIRGAHVLAVKSRIFDVPWADAGFGVGMARLDEWRDRLAELRTRVYWAVDQIDRPPPKNITLLKRLDGQNLSSNPGEIYSGGACGFAALQICLHKRAKEIVLFGFDYDGSYNGGATDKRRARNVEYWSALAEHFRIYVPFLNAHGIHITNACPTSAIRCFQKVALRDGAAMLREKIAA